MLWKSLLQGLMPMLQPVLTTLVQQLFKNLLDQLSKNMPGTQASTLLSEDDIKAIVTKTMSDLSN